MSETSGGIKTPKLSGQLPLADPELELAGNAVAPQDRLGSPGSGGVTPSSSQAGGTGGPGCAVGGGKHLTHRGADY